MIPVAAFDLFLRNVVVAYERQVVLIGNVVDENGCNKHKEPTPHHKLPNVVLAVYEVLIFKRCRCARSAAMVHAAIWITEIALGLCGLLLHATHLMSVHEYILQRGIIVCINAAITSTLLEQLVLRAVAAQ